MIIIVGSKDINLRMVSGSDFGNMCFMRGVVSDNVEYVFIVENI